MPITPLVAEELRARNGLPNLFAKLKGGGPVRIAYQGDGMEVEIAINQGAPIPLKSPQTENKRTLPRFLYLPKQRPGQHTAVIKIKGLPEGVSYQSGQILVVG